MNIALFLYSHKQFNCNKKICIDVSFITNPILMKFMISVPKNRTHFLTKLMIVSVNNGRIWNSETTVIV